MSSAMQEKDAIRELMSEYCHLVDSDEIDAWVGLFTDDAVIVDQDGGRHSGPLAFAALYRGVDSDTRARRKHFTTNEIIRVDGDTATARSTFIVVEQSQSEPAIGPKMVGIYEDRCVKLESCWRFKERKISMRLIDG